MSVPLSPRDRYRLALRYPLRSRRSIMTQSKPSPSKGIKARWHDVNTLILLEILIQEIQIGNRANGYFTPEGWKNILHKFQVRTGLTYNESQIKSRTNQLRSTFAKWKRLNDRATGLGFDLTSDTIRADDQWWENMGREDPKILKWKESPPKFLDLMHLCFAGTLATGNDTYISSSCASCDPIDGSQAGVEEQHNQANFTHSALNVGPSTSASNPTDTWSLQSCNNYPHRLCDSVVDIRASIIAKEQWMDERLKQEIDLAINLLNANEEINKNGTFYVKCVKVLYNGSRRYTFVRHISKLSFSLQIRWFSYYV